MVDVIGRAKVIITGDVDSRSVDQAGGKIGRSLKAGAIVGVAALGTITAAGFKLYQGFEEGEAQGRKLAQVLQNMGAGAATEEVEALATQISRLTGVNEDVIKQGQTLLGTFSEVAKTAGEQGGLFDRATRAAVDLAATGFGSVESSSIQLGKALQEPAKGVAALSRTGAFTKAQQEYVKSLDETGKRAEAQAFILKVLEDQVKGTAETSATESQKIQNALGEAGDAVGNILDTLAGGKNPEAGDSKGLSTQIDDVTDSLNKFAQSEGLKEFSRELGEINTDLQDGDTFLGTWAEGIEEMGLSLLDLPGIFNDVREKFGNLKADIEDGGLFDGVSNSLEDAEKDLGRGLRNMKTKIGDTIDDIKETAGDWAEAGRKLIGDFLRGFASGPVPFQLGQKVKDAINKALPNTITFFGGRGGIPAITVDVPQFAGGVRNFSGGLARVGENGPELVSLPTGSNVYSNSESNRLMSDAGGDTVNQIYNFYGPGSLSEARREGDWGRRYGTRFGAATAGAAL